MIKLGIGALAAVALVGCAGGGNGGAGLESSAAAVTMDASIGPVAFIDGSIVEGDGGLYFQVTIPKGIYEQEFLLGSNSNSNGNNGNGNGQTNDASLVVRLGDECAAPATLVPATSHGDVAASNPGYIWTGFIDLSNCGGGAGELDVSHHCANGCVFETCDPSDDYVPGTSLDTSLSLWAFNGPGESRCEVEGVDAACQVASGVTIEGGATVNQTWSGGNWSTNTSGEHVCSGTHSCNGNEGGHSCDDLWPL